MKTICIFLALVLLMPLVAAAEFSCNEFFADGRTQFRWEFINTSTQNSDLRNGHLYLKNNGEFTGEFDEWKLEGNYRGDEIRFWGHSKSHTSKIEGNGKCTNFSIVGFFWYVNGGAKYSMRFSKF